MTSLALPAENGTMTLIGLEVACWAWAGILTPAAVSAIPRAAAAARAPSLQIRFILVSWWCSNHRVRYARVSGNQAGG